uniref:Uncharacterized protein n=1 Tax=viral metagenome TaxID=1070528 RepID=A0A6C0KWD5_9ZZZZ
MDFQLSDFILHNGPNSPTSLNSPDGPTSPNSPAKEASESHEDNNKINCIKIYFSKNNSIGWSNINFKSQFNNNNPVKIKTIGFHNRNLVYLYDTTNDSQKIIKEKFIKDNNTINNLYIIGYHKEILPTHAFPCTDDIVHTEELETYIYRINNRMFIYLEIENNIQYIYIKYNHSNNIDLTKMQHDLSRTLSWIRRNVSMEPI